MWRWRDGWTNGEERGGRRAAYMDIDTEREDTETPDTPIHPTHTHTQKKDIHAHPQNTHIRKRERLRQKRGNVCVCVNAFAFEEEEGHLLTQAKKICVLPCVDQGVSHGLWYDAALRSWRLITPRNETVRVPLSTRKETRLALSHWPVRHMDRVCVRDPILRISCRVFAFSLSPDVPVEIRFESIEATDGHCDGATFPGIGGACAGFDLAAHTTFASNKSSWEGKGGGGGRGWRKDDVYREWGDGENNTRIHTQKRVEERGGRERDSERER